MGRAFKLLLKVVIVLGALASFLLARTLIAGGVFANLDETLTAKCERIPAKPGAEDITIDHDRRLGFVSAEDRRTKYAGGTPGRGGLFVFSLDDPAGTMRETALSGPADFQPHGVGLYKGEEGDRIFAVSHPHGGGHVIEIFDITEAGDLVHAESVSDPGIYSPNEVIPVGPRQFYVTNDNPPYTGFRATLEQYLLLGNTNALYYDGEKAVEVVSGLKSANGINVSADGKTVYISEVTGKRIAVYDRNMETNALTRRDRLKVATMPDNIEFGSDGMLYTGGHTKVFDYLAHAEDASNIAVSHVMRIDPVTGGTKDILISVDGGYQAATVGAATDDRIFIGSVFEPDILSCPLK